MAEDREGRIRHRAYDIWQEEGCPEGRHHEHWLRAEREVTSTDDALDASNTGTGAPGEAGEPPAGAQATPRRRGRAGATANDVSTEKVNGAETLTPAPDEAQPAAKPSRRTRRTAEVDPG